ncbi:MAG: hypothetical protein HRU19_23925 [Pseudobacteriovorax sp.]|nr:hypothetical protein [Pseudobacteriovorax sp.]
MIKEFSFAESGTALDFVLISPHSSQGGTFFDAFPEIFADEAVDAKKSEFLEYVHLESDFGAFELSLSIAESLSLLGHKVTCLELDYPRGIVDGGRVLDHCIREALPGSLLNSLRSRFLLMHQQSLNRLHQLYQTLNESSGFLLDIHSMASFNPVHNMQTITKPVSFENLSSYCQQFYEAPRSEDNLRLIDIISKDEHGNAIANEYLRKHLCESLARNGFQLQENIPYWADSAFMMNYHMMRTQAIAIDIPKHLLSNSSDPLDFDIKSMKISDERARHLGKMIATASSHALGSYRDSL